MHFRFNKGKVIRIIFTLILGVAFILGKGAKPTSQQRTKFFELRTWNGNNIATIVSNNGAFVSYALTGTHKNHDWVDYCTTELITH